LLDSPLFHIIFTSSPKKITALKPWGWLIGLLLCLAGQGLWAQDLSAGISLVESPIEPHWDSLAGMQYLQNGRLLSGGQLKILVDSFGDPQAQMLLAQSESNETFGYLTLGGSLSGSLVCLFLPDTILHIGNLKISLPYLPVQLPALALGVFSAFLQNAAGSEKYGAVQRYNRKVQAPGAFSWDLSGDKNGPRLNFHYAL
jgi:hypothetical protein